LRATEGVDACEGIPFDALTRVLSEAGIRLPLEHFELLCGSNGLTAYHGYYRMFGMGRSRATDAFAWNHPECWRFAWDARCSPFWCFGETAWGDQYAYKVDDLRGRGSQPVYFLEGLAMTPEVIAASFSDFLHGELIRNAIEPYSEMTRLAKEKFGPIQASFHLVYSPSILLGGEDSIDNVQLMDAVTAMVFRGDIATQIDNAPPGKRVSSVEPYQDEKSRMRLRLIWEPV
jgi:hypothetical protein